MEARRLSSDTEIPAVGATVGDFWAWAFSDVLSNTARGVLAEFLVGSALGVVEGVRMEWAPLDLLYEEAKIEVKSAAYVQRWFQKRHSVVEWKDIGEHSAWDATTGTSSEEVKRWAANLVINPGFCRVLGECGPKRIETAAQRADRNAMATRCYRLTAF